MNNFILKRLFAILIQSVLIIFAYILSFYLRFEFSIPSLYLLVLVKTLPLLIIIKIIVFYYFALLSGAWRYTGIYELWRLLKALSLSTIIFILATVFIYGLQRFPRSVFILDWILSLILIGGARFLSRSSREIFRHPSRIKNKKTIIIGAGEAGIMVLRECRSNPNMGAEIIGFIDDDPAKRGLHIQDIKVLGTRYDLPKVIEKYKIEEVIIAIPSAKGQDIRSILSHCEIPGIKIKIVPYLHKIIGGELELRPRQVKPEDLLGREIVKIEENEIASYIHGKRILVTGAGGSIGSEICRQIAGFLPEQIISFDHNENDVYFLEVEFKTKYPKVNFETIIGDINDVSLLKYTFSHYKPHIVFHSAAFKHVPLMEENPVAAIKNNVIGSRKLIYTANHYKVEKFILISTDKAVNPTSIMGMTKRIAEMILQAKAKNSRTKFIAVRFGNVIGSSGSVVPLFKKQIEEGGPITVTHPEAKRYFMSVKEAVSLVLQAGAIGKGGEIFILDMGEQIKIIDIAKNLIALSGLKLDKDILIDFIGLRPGEKLSEEILLNIEKDKVTKHDKIYITQPSDFDSAKLHRQIKELEQLSTIMDKDKIISKIKEIIYS